ncbi:MAG: hypothetical protein JWM59_1242 [Verrucomicrobiales bacterium]|nr:hypothetical protein [Verrucomicrobiales bacterium]
MRVVIHPTFTAGSVSDRFFPAIEGLILRHQNQFIIEEKFVNPINFAVCSVVWIETLNLSSFFPFYWDPIGI